MIIRLTVLLPVSLPSYISHSHSISLMLPSSSQSGAPHLHISLALSSLLLHFLFLSAALALFPSSSLSANVPCLFPVFCLLTHPTAAPPVYLSLSVHAPSLPHPHPPPPPLLPSSFSPLPSLALSPFRALQCGCVGDDVRDAVAGVSSGCVYIRVLQPCGLQPVSGWRQRWEASAQHTHTHSHTSTCRWLNHSVI